MTPQTKEIAIADLHGSAGVYRGPDVPAVAAVEDRGAPALGVIVESRAMDEADGWLIGRAF